MMAEQTGAKKVALTAVTGTTAGGALKVQNDFGGDVIVTDLILDITTEATGAANVDAGIDDAGDASSDNLIDGLDVGSAAGVFDNHTDAGTNGGMAKWAEGEYLVITASATLAGLVGNAYIKWVRV
jgi:hypothetical protein